MSARSAPRALPSPDGLAAEWYAHCARGELRFQRCTACGRWQHPPRLVCAACGAEKWEWARSSGRARLFSWTVTHQPTHPAFSDAVPYVIAVAELDEGVRIVANVRDIEPDALRLDLPVFVEVEPATDDIGLLVVTPSA